MAAGLIMIVAAFLPIPGWAVPMLVIALTVVMAGIPVAYSYLLWRRERAGAHTSG